MGRAATLRRALLLMAVLLLVVDFVGGVTELWATERSRAWTSRLRLAVDLLACAAAAAPELSALAPHVRARSTILPAFSLLALATAAGLVGALVANAQGWPAPHDHEWIFAVESAGVLVLLLPLLVAHARESRDAPLSRALREGDG